MERSSEERRGGKNRLEDNFNTKKIEGIENSQLLNGSELASSRTIMNKSQLIIVRIVFMCV